MGVPGRSEFPGEERLILVFRSAQPCGVPWRYLRDGARRASSWREVPVSRRGKTTDPIGEMALRAIEGEDLAGRCAARLLISGTTGPAVETVARRIHAASARRDLPFIRVRAAGLPNEPGELRATCSRLLDVAMAGTLMMSDVETMPPLVQDRLIELLDELELARRPAAAVRLVSGTTALLFDLVAAGRFSRKLFYRLNTLHVIADNVASGGERA